MRKLVITLMILAIAAAGAFAGGSQGGAAGDVQTYTYWTDNPNAQPGTPLYQVIEEEVGIRLEASGVQEDDYAAKLQLAAAADDMPDVMGRIIQDSVPTLGRQGLLLPLSDTKDELPNMWKAIESRNLDIMAQSGIFGDGKGEFWMIPRIAYNRICAAPWYRVDWFEETGMSVPTTPDELYELLKAVKKNHPDSIPFMARASWATLMATRSWFGVRFTPMGEVEEVSDEYKTMLKWMRKLYDEDLIDKEWPTGSDNLVKQAFNAGKVFMEYGAGAAAPGYYGSFLKERGIGDAEFNKGLRSIADAKEYTAMVNEHIVFLPPISNRPDGKVVPICVDNTRAGFSDSGMSFKADIENVDKAYELIEWIFQPDAHAYYTAIYGKRGVNWDLDSDGIGRPKETFDATQWSGDGAFMMVTDRANLRQPLVQGLQVLDEMVKDNAYLETRDIFSWPDDRTRQRWSDLRAAITPIINQWQLMFATGQADIDAQWGEYLAALDKAGFQEFQKLQRDSLTPDMPHLQPLSQFMY